MASDKFGILSYRCNICGNACETKIKELGRETASCPSCNSSVRMRSLVYLLSIEFFGQPLALPDFPARPDITGIGLSDWEGYANPLSKKLSYKNTFYHKEPRLDITNVSPLLAGTLDFLIASDVFEHIPPPVSTAFENACKLLKPEGVFIFTVPYTRYGKTDEHFPDLYEYQITDIGGGCILRNITKDGREQVFENLTFHGGHGSTLEMRLFSESALIKEFEKAGFQCITMHEDPYFEFGIYWNTICLPVTARKKLPFKSELQPLKLPEEVNSLSFNVDKLIQRENSVEIRGWAYITNENTDNMTIFIVLRSNGNTYIYNTEKVKRHDVTAHFKTFNFDDSGFHAVVFKDGVESGDYRVGLFLKKDSIYALQFSNITIFV